MVSRLTHPLALSVRYREPGAKQIKKGWKMGRIDGLGEALCKDVKQVQTF